MFVLKEIKQITVTANFMDAIDEKSIYFAVLRQKRVCAKINFVLIMSD